MKKGFTLVEIVIVTAAVGLIMIAMMGVVLGTFRSQNKGKSSSRVAENGTWILNELRRNILSSSSKRISCISNQSIGFTNIDNGESTVLSCEDVSGYRIASVSAEKGTLVLTGSEVTVDCGTAFVSCETLPSLEVSAVNFNFGLTSFVSGVGTSQDFNLKVTIRN
jgi:prepilin-type N-terminal cleavage/methylation domain-containing protein